MAFQVGCGDEGLLEQLGCIAQHVELAKLRHVQVVGDREGGEGMLLYERTVSFCSRIRLMVSKVTSTSTGAGPGKGRSGNSRLGLPFCISLASVEGRLGELP
jgi:hypothetical protein